MPDMWMDVDAALSEVPVNLLALVDDTDFKTREESVVYNQAGLDLLWNFTTTAGAFTQTAVTPTEADGDYDWTNQGNGYYTIEIPASGGASINNNTEGFGWFSGFATGILPWAGPVIGFRAAGLNNALIDGGDLLDVNVTHVADTSQTGNDNGADINTIVAKLPSKDYLRGTADSDGGMDTEDKADVQAECEDAYDAKCIAAADLVDDVWDEATADHQVAGSVGKKLDDIVGGGDATEAKQDSIIAAVITNAAGADIAADIIAVKADTAAVLADTDTLETDLKSYLDDIETNLDGDIEANDTLIDTAITDIAAVKGDTAAILIDTDTMEADLTTQINANETKIDTLDTVADGIQTDLSNATDGLGALKTLIDTMDTVADAIKTKTDNLPADPASETNVNANETKIDAVKADTAAILIDTDTMEADLTTEINANETKIDTLDTVADGIQTDLSNATDGLGALKTLIEACATPAEVATALTTYDAPTKAEMDTAHALLATVAKQDVIDGIVDNILLDTGTDGVILKAAGLNADAVDKIIDEVIEGTVTLRQLLRIALAVLAGKTTGGGTVTVNFRNVADTKNRVIATVDADGNRTAITLDGA